MTAPKPTAERLRDWVGAYWDRARNGSDLSRDERELLLHAADELDRLRKALEPFASFVGLVPKEGLRGISDVLYKYIGPDGEAELRLSDCVRAREAVQ